MDIKIDMHISNVYYLELPTYICIFFSINQISCKMRTLTVAGLEP